MTFLKKIIFIIPILASINLVAKKLAFSTISFPLKSQIKQLIQAQFSSKMPYYYNYWIIYIAIAIIIALVLLFVKQHTISKTLLVIGINVFIGLLIMFDITKSM